MTGHIHCINYSQNQLQISASFTRKKKGSSKFAKVLKNTQDKNYDFDQFYVKIQIFLISLLLMIFSDDLQYQTVWLVGAFNCYYRKSRFVDLEWRNKQINFEKRWILRFS